VDIAYVEGYRVPRALHVLYVENRLDPVRANTRIDWPAPVRIAVGMQRLRRRSGGARHLGGCRE